MAEFRVSITAQLEALQKRQDADADALVKVSLASCTPRVCNMHEVLCMVLC